MRAQDRKLRILLVEDSLITVEQLAQIVQSGVSSLRIVVTASEEAAIAHLHSVGLDTRPDIVILDLSIRKSSYVNVLRAARNSSNAPTVVVLTESDRPDDRDLAARMGADYFLNKDGLDKDGNTESLAHIIRSVAARIANDANVTAALHDELTDTDTQNSDDSFYDSRSSQKPLH